MVYLPSLPIKPANLVSSPRSVLTLSGVSLETPLPTHPTQVIWELILETAAFIHQILQNLQTCIDICTASLLSQQSACESTGPASQNDGVITERRKICLIKNRVLFFVDRFINNK